MTLRTVQSGDAISAASHNRLIDQVNALARPGAAVAAQYGAAGVTFCAPAETLIGLFELTGSIAYPANDGASDHFDREPTPYATARQVFCHQFSSQDVDGSGAAIRSYQSPPAERDCTIWFPLCFRDTNGYAIGPLPIAIGMRLFCIFDRQSGRWEALSPSSDLLPIELKTDLSPGKSATAYVLVASTGCPGQYETPVADGSGANMQITVFDQPAGNRRALGRDSVAQSGNGARGTAQWDAATGQYQLRDLQTLAKMILVSGPSSTVQPNTYFQPTTLQVLDDGQSPIPLGGLSALNITSWSVAIPSGVQGIVCVADGGGGYLVIDAPCMGGA